ncbi:MAG: calcium/sodium antiporter [Rhodospirillales bacterium]|jgi:cation:H+ antiporter|nr:calcium/sodium antiporter [Rhodospirillales bacterium]
MSPILFIVAGFALLFAGGESLVRGSVAVATRLGVSKLVIGLTLVGFGTSMPELVTSLQAALAGAPAIAIGNVVGTNIANILLILGISAMVRPLPCDPAALRRDGSVMVAATVVLAGLALIGGIGRPAAGLLVAGLVAYLTLTFFNERRNGSIPAQMHIHEAEDSLPANPSLPLNMLVTAIGIAAVIAGAWFLVEGASALARRAGVSEGVIGLTVVAVGTSLPELATSVVAAYKRHADVALGNIIGSCIFNILAILGVTALVHPLPFPIEMARFDVWIALGTTLVLMIFAFTSRRLSRTEGGLMLAAYFGYIAILAVGAL